MPSRRLPAACALALGLLAGAAGAFDLQGHRGARGLAPENTLAGFARALAVGVDTLELDTVVTRDDVVVVSHDPTLNPNLARDADGHWIAAPGPAVRSLTLAALQGYDVGRIRPATRYAQAHPQQQPVDGARVPTLDEVFALVRASGATHVRFNIETKITPDDAALTPPPEAFVALVLAAAARHGMTGRISLQSFDWRTLQAVRRLAPEVPRVALTVQQAGFDNVSDGRWTAGVRRADHASVPAMAAAAAATVWSPAFGDVTAESLGQARALGLPVVVWTVNEPAQIERMLDLGVDGIISDRPDRVREAMARRGMPLPAPVAAQPSPSGGAAARQRRSASR